MHEAGAAVQRQPAAHHIDGGQFRFGVTRGHIDDESPDVAINHPVERPLYHLVMLRDDHSAAGALLKEVAGKVESVLFTLYTACSSLKVSSRHPPAFPGAPAGIPRVKAAQPQAGRRLCLSVMSWPVHGMPALKCVYRAALNS